MDQQSMIQHGPAAPRVSLSQPSRPARTKATVIPTASQALEARVRAKARSATRVVVPAVSKIAAKNQARQS